jgi:clan AA aspartic protease (TIGR02281 family)
MARAGRLGRTVVIICNLRCQADHGFAGWGSANQMIARMIRGVLALALAVSPVFAAEMAVAATRAQETIPIEAQDGAYVVPVLVNGLLPLKFIVDSGSADVSIPADVASTLKKLGTLSGADLLGSKTYLLADGSKVSSEIYRIESLKIGGLVMQNVTVRVSAEKSSLLLGQSFLSRLKSWSVDNAKQILIIYGNGT